MAMPGPSDKWVSYEGEMKRSYFCLSYLDPNMRLKRSEVCTSVCLSYVDPNMMDELKRSLSVCLTWILV